MSRSRFKNRQMFIEHCCHARHYYVCNKKCGNSSCNICKPPLLPQPISVSVPYSWPCTGQWWTALQTLDLYGKSRHSLQVASQHRKSHGIHFSNCAQAAMTVSQIVMCSECLRPRTIYVQRKLSFQEGIHCACIDDMVENWDVYPICNYFFKECPKTYRRKRPQF